MEVAGRIVGATLAHRVARQSSHKHRVVAKALLILGLGVLALAHGDQVDDLYISQLGSTRHERSDHIERLPTRMPGNDTIARFD